MMRRIPAHQGDKDRRSELSLPQAIEGNAIDQFYHMAG